MPKRVPHSKRHLTVKAIARPEIDTHKLARAFMYMAIERAKKQSGEGSDHDTSRP